MTFDGRLSKKWKLLTWATHRAKTHFPYYLKWVFTLDTAEQDPDKRVKRFPYQKEYHQVLAHRIQYEDEKLIHLVKSRQLQMSWLHAAYLSWGLLSPGYYGYIQSKKKEDSDDFIKDRVVHIWDHLPRWMRYIATGGIHADVKECRITAPNKSRVIGVAQGGDQFRGYVPSFVFLDEVGSFTEFEETITSITPILQKGVKAVCCSTARPSEWGEIVTSDNVASSKKEIIKGLHRKQLEYGGTVYYLSYKADPDKDPERYGKDWYLEELSKTPGGPEGSKWQQEMEMKFDAKLGDRIFPSFKDEEPYVVEPFDIPEHWDKWRAIDWGSRNPTAVLWLARDPETRIYYIYREFYKPSKSVPHTKRVISHMSRGESYKATWIDPATDRHDSKEFQSIWYRLKLEPNPINAWKANRADAGIDLINDWFENMDSEGQVVPRLRVFSDCPNTIKELLHYRYEDWATVTEERRNPKETPRKKMDHAMNAAKYFANGVLHQEKKEKEREKKRGEPEPGSIGWYLKTHLGGRRKAHNVRRLGI